MEHQTGVCVCDGQLPQQLKRRVFRSCDLGHHHSGHEYTFLLPEPEVPVLGHQIEEEEHKGQ